MHTIVDDTSQKDELIEDILQDNGDFVRISKLITDQGKVTGVGDMIELIQVMPPINDTTTFNNTLICNVGKMHLALGVDDIDATIKKVSELGGGVLTSVHIMGNGNKCCFCADPEGNIIELIMKTNDK